MNDTTMDNQQVTSENWAWLAGIWDGEGSFSITKLEKEKGKVFYVSHITLSNTSEAMVNEVVRLLDSVEIKCHLWQGESREANYKPAYHLTIYKSEQKKLFTEKVLPYLINKKPHAQLFLRFVNSRLKYKKQPIQDEKTGKIIGMKGNSYTEEEKELFAHLKELNKRGLI